MKAPAGRSANPSGPRRPSGRRWRYQWLFALHLVVPLVDGESGGFLYSLLTFLAFLSSRKPTNLLCRRWLSDVHSTNSNCPTSFGVSHRHSTIFPAVRPSPQRPAFFSGRFSNGHSLISNGLIFLNTSALDAGVKPLRVRAA